MTAKIVQVTNVYFEDGCANAWQPKTFHVVDDVSFVQLKKTDYKLTRALAELCGVDTSALRYKDQPSLVNSLAYKRMQTARNAQANAICSAQQEAAAATDTSSLFGSDATKVLRSSAKRRKSWMACLLHWMSTLAALSFGCYSLSSTSLTCTLSLVRATSLILRRLSKPSVVAQMSYHPRATSEVTELVASKVSGSLEKLC